MIRSDDMKQFIDQRDPYVEDLAHTINRIKERERPGLKRLLLEITEKIHLTKEEEMGQTRLNDTPAVRAILVATGLAALYGTAKVATRGLQDLSTLVQEHGCFRPERAKAA